MKPAERKTVNRRVVFFAGKAAPACMSLLFLYIFQYLMIENLDYIAKLVCGSNTFRSLF